MRLNPVIFFSSLVRSHSSQQVLGLVPIVAPLGGRSASPLRPAVAASSTPQICLGSGAQPGT